MDILDNYKKAWKDQTDSSTKLSASEIYKLAHSNSSSIVKWIFIIGLLEFILLNSLYLFVDLEDANKTYSDLGIVDVVWYSQIICYLVLFYFLYQFYMNYKNISVVESTKGLLTKIIKTRKTVRNYVIFNLAYVVFVIVTVTSAVLFNSNEYPFNTSQSIWFVLIMFFITIIFVGLFYLFYQLLYGILLKKLHKNYREIATLDVE